MRPATRTRPSKARRARIEALRSSLGELLGAERRLRGRDQQRHGELTIAQVRALAALSREDEATAGQLARAADLNPASMTAMIDHLEQIGIVERRRSSEDRRVCYVSLTDRGREVLDEKRVRWEELWKERLASISDADLEATIRVMRHIAEMLDTIR